MSLLRLLVRKGVCLSRYSCKTTGMVKMNMIDNNFLYYNRIYIGFSHIIEQYRAICTSIKEYFLTIYPYKTGETPARPKTLFPYFIVVK